MNRVLIKNLKLPICISCKHFVLPKSAFIDIEYGKCNQFGSKNIITGDIEYTYARKCREFDSLCGKEGKLYNEMPDPRDAVQQSK